MGDQQATYPAHLATDVVLRDGSTVHVRPVRPDDEPRLLAFLRSLSEQSLVLRFFSHTSDTVLGHIARQETRVDYARHYGLVATRGVGDRIVGHALYAAMTEENAEVAFAVADDYQGRGLGTILVGRLAEVAAAHGFQAFTAFVMHENYQMLAVFRESGFPIDVKPGAGELTVTFPTSLTPEALERFDRRDQVAAVNALKLFLAPRSIAVIGASRRRGTIGGELFHNLLTYEFAGPVYPINPQTAVVQSVPAYIGIEALPAPRTWPSWPSQPPKSSAKRSGVRAAA